jgi:hypothetical protein
LPLLHPRLIASGLRLDRRDRVRALRALGWLIAATTAVRVLSYGTLTHTIGRIAIGRTSRTAITPDQCATAIRRAARLWPAACLPRAVAGYCLLRRGGLQPTLTLGVAKAGERLAAHAWLECEGMMVTGADVDARYTPIAAEARRPS